MWIDGDHGVHSPLHSKRSTTIAVGLVPQQLEILFHGFGMTMGLREQHPVKRGHIIRFRQIVEAAFRAFYIESIAMIFAYRRPYGGKVTRKQVEIDQHLVFSAGESGRVPRLLQQQGDAIVDVYGNAVQPAQSIAGFSTRDAMIAGADAVEACGVDQPAAIPCRAIASQPFGGSVVKILITGRIIGLVAGEMRYGLAAVEADQGG